MRCLLRRRKYIMNSNRSTRAEQIYVNGRFLTQSTTGVQRYARELLMALDRKIDQGGLDLRPQQVIVLAPKNVKGGLQLKHIPIRQVGSLPGNLWVQIELPFYVRDGLLVSFCNTGPLAVKRQVVTIHDAAILDHPEWFKASFVAWYRFLVPRLMRRVIRVITVSNFSKTRLLEHSGIQEDQIIVLPNGVASYFHPTSPNNIDILRQKLGLPDRYILVVGSLEPRKNLARLFTAWERLHPKFSKIYLVVAGGKGKAFGDLGFGRVPSGVQLLGYVADEELPALYSGALIFVYPSVYEGFGLPPLEAMACGTPVVTSDTGAIPEVVGEAAIKVNPYDVEAIACGIRHVLEDSALRENLCRKGWERARRFTWERTAKLTWEVLRDAAAK